MLLKGTEVTTIYRDEDGFPHIIQADGRIKLGADQVAAMTDWLRDGNGLCLQHDWKAGVSLEAGE